MTTLRAFAALALLFGFVVVLMWLLLNEAVHEGEDGGPEDDPAP